MPALRPIQTTGLKDEYFPRSTADEEALAVFMVQQGTYRDTAFRTTNRPSRLSALTAGSRVQGAVIQGGSV